MTEDTVPALDYPTTPTFNDEQSVRNFVETFERAYRRNDLLDQHGGELISHKLGFDWSVTLDTSEDAAVGRCQYHYTLELGGDASAIGDSPFFVVTYYVDDSILVRAEDTGDRDRQNKLDPDPWETGAILEPAE